MGTAKIVASHNALRKVLFGSRKIGRAVAIARAEHNVEEQRQVFTQGLADQLSRIETLAGVNARDLPEADLRETLYLSTVIFNLAGTLGSQFLQSVAASLYDLLAVMLDRGLRCSEPIMVHAHAARLAAPGMPPVSQDQAQRLLGQLKETVSHFRDKPDPCNNAECAVCPAKAIPA